MRLVPSIRYGVLKVARSISQAAQGEEGRKRPELAIRGKVLIEYMEKNARGLGIEAGGRSSVLDDEGDEEIYREELCSLSWVPVMVEPPNSWIPWNNSGNQASGGRLRYVAPPRRVRTIEDAPLVSCIYGICSVTIKNQALAIFLGWTEPVPPLVIAQQLLEYGAIYGGDNEAGAGAAPLLEPMTVPSTLPEVVRETVLGIYDGLAMQTMDEAFDQVCAALRGKKSLLLDTDQFVDADKVAFECEADLTPLLHAYPPGLEGFENLFAVLGVKARFTCRDLIRGMQAVAAVSGGHPLEEEQVCFRPPNHGNHIT